MFWGTSEEVFEPAETERVYQVTFNGNPLSMAAARASLFEVLTPEAYVHLDALNDRILTGCRDVIERYSLPGYAVGVGAKGCVTFAGEDRRLRELRPESGRGAHPISPGSMR